jgi:hypothetical protein
MRTFPQSHYARPVTDTFEQFCPVEEAEEVITGRLAQGWSLLGLEGFWVDEDGLTPDLTYIFDGSPQGLHDAQAVEALLETWPREESFRVEVLLVR